MEEELFHCWFPLRNTYLFKLELHPCPYAYSAPLNKTLRKSSFVSKIFLVRVVPMVPIDVISNKNY